MHPAKRRRRLSDTKGPRQLGAYILNVLIGIDQLGNAMAGGDPDETISSRIGKIKLKNLGRVPWTKPLTKAIDAGLDLIDPGHSVDSVEEDEGGRQLKPRHKP